MTHDARTHEDTAHSSPRPASPARPKRVRIRGLDGLRALAAALVLGYHFFPGYAEAGFVGVDVFFVLSGFLITALLLREHAETGTLNIRGFLARRYRRLLPAVAVATAGSFALGLVVSRDAIVQAWWQIVGALTGTYNWFELANHSSYFDQESPYLLANMWSLAVEQQFYLLWPFLVLLVLALRGRSRRTAIPVALALASVIWSAVLVVLAAGGDVTRAYVGTDSHFFGLALGAALAFWLPGIMRLQLPEQPSATTQAHSAEAAYDASGEPEAMERNTAEARARNAAESRLQNGAAATGRNAAGTAQRNAGGPTARAEQHEVLPGARPAAPETQRIAGIAGIVAVVVLVAFALFAPGGHWLYPWGMLVASLLALLVIRAMLPDMEGSPASALLWAVFDSAPMRWLGERSYGIYLWHWPLIVLFRYGTNLAMWQAAILVTALSIHFAHLSYTYIESPIRREGFMNWLRARLARAGRAKAGMAAVAVIALGAGVLAASPAKTQMQAQIEAGQAAGAKTQGSASEAGEGAGEVEVEAANPATDNGDTDEKAEAAAREAEAEAAAKAEKKTRGYPSIENGANVTFIGDSLGAGATPSLLEMLPDAYADAVPNRQMHQAIEIIAGLKESGELRPYVALWIGTNGGVLDSQLQVLLDTLGEDHYLVLTTLHAPHTPAYNYVHNANVRIYQFAAEHPDRVRLAKWDEIHPEINDATGIHPGPDGYKTASAEIVRALKSFPGEE